MSVTRASCSRRVATTVQGPVEDSGVLKMTTELSFGHTARSEQSAFQACRVVAVATRASTTMRHEAPRGALQPLALLSSLASAASAAWTLRSARPADT
eukprot:6210381-Pleurochrysis_carterae.AAC.2